jgi:hypothetical protein
MIPDKSEKIWTLLVTGKKTYQYKVLPVSVLLSRMLLSTQKDNSPENIQHCIDETYNFFVRYETILKKDIENIFGDNTNT